VEYWTWWLLAVALAIGEVFAPGAALLWIGLAAAAVGLTLMLFPDLELTTQMLIFAVGTLAAMIGVRVWVRLRSREQDGERHGEDHPHLNRRAQHYVGTVHKLESAIVNGRGRARVDDGSWTVEGPDLPAGASVRVVGVSGVILRVEKADQVL
jgi:inner membrane protein